MEILDRYLAPSRFVERDGGGDMTLATAAGLTPQGLVANPRFFSGTVVRPDVAASGLRALVEIASTRYFNPIPGGFKSLDPVVTAQGDRLRCEAFSACNGIYARLDLMADTFDAALGFGTTNIDINPPLARALAAIRPEDHLHLDVGADRIVFEAGGEALEERKVQLPERWVRGLAETQSLAPGLALRHRLDAAAWRRFINGLPMSGGSGAGASLWLLPSSSGFRQTRHPQPGSVALAGCARLGAMKRLQHLVQSVQVYGPDVHADTKAAISAWEFFLTGARLVLMVTPESWRGFSGEGAILHALGESDMSEAHALDALLAWEASIDVPALASEAGMSEARARAALAVLAVSGHVGFDLHEGTHFHRQLPFVESRLEENYPRLRAARGLVDAGAVALDGDRVRVRSEDHDHYVSTGTAQARCTCYFWSRHRGSRGPCKHVLAAQLFLAS